MHIVGRTTPNTIGGLGGEFNEMIYLKYPAHRGWWRNGAQNELGWLSADAEGVWEKLVLEQSQPRLSLEFNYTGNCHQAGREHMWHLALSLPLREEVTQERTVVMDSRTLKRIQIFQGSPEHSKHL